MTDRRRRHQTDRDFGDARYGDEERVAWVEGAGDADDRGGVAGEDEAVSGEISRAHRSERAQPDPDRERPKEEYPFLGEKGDQDERADGADNSPDHPIEAFREHQTALRLRHDEDCQERPFRLV